MPDPTPRPKRAAVLFIPESILAAMLRLPDGWSIGGIRDDFLRQGVVVQVTGPDLPEIPPGMEPYRLPDVTYCLQPPPKGSPEGAAPRLYVMMPDWEQEIPPD